MINDDLFAPDGYLSPYHLYLDDIDVEERIDVVTGYTAHEGQLVFHDSTARFRIATCGRRFGKTTMCGAEIVKFALENENALCWWVAPYYRTAQTAYRMVSKAVAPYLVHNLKSEMRLELENGSVIEFRSADNPDALRGEGVSFLVMDECAMIKREAWEESLRPTLSDTNGKAMFISTPKGRNWFFELFVRGQSEDFPDYESFQFPTSANPYIPASEIEEVEKTLPTDVYRQEYLAEFLEESAGVFRNIRACVQGEFEEPVDGRFYLIGFDLARHQDWSVMTVIDAKTRHVVAFDRFNQIDWSTQINRLETLARKYNNAKIIMDSTGVGDAVYEMAYDRGLDVEAFHFHHSSKKQLIQNLSVMIERQEITFPEIPDLIQELQIFQYEISEHGNIKYSAPVGLHDDCVMSLALSAWGLKEYAQPTQIFI